MPEAPAATTASTTAGDGTTAATINGSSCPWEKDMEGLLARIAAYLDAGGAGYDTRGREYDDLRELWGEMGLVPRAFSADQGDDEEGEKDAQSQQKQKQQEEQQQQPAWYSQAFDYWEAEGNCPATDDGVLGGFGHVSPKDIAGSRAFVERMRTALPNLRFGRAVDCGAGIGRVTKHLLLPLFDKVDLLEQSPRLLAAAPAYLRAQDDPSAAAAAADADGPPTSSSREAGGPAEAAGAAGAAGELAERVTYVCAGMQDFDPAAGAYDVVWIQWCVGHLHDLDLLRFLRRCKGALRRAGCVVVKDNCCTDVDFVLDCDDSSVTRSPAYLKALFRIAGFDLRLEERQKGFPSELLPVYMFSFTPRPF